MKLVPRRTSGRLTQALFIASLLLCALPRVGLAQDPPADSPPPTQQSGDSSSGTSGPTCNCSRPAGASQAITNCIKALADLETQVSGWGAGIKDLPQEFVQTIAGSLYYGIHVCNAAGVDNGENLACDWLRGTVQSCTRLCKLAASSDPSDPYGLHPPTPNYCAECAELASVALTCVPAGKKSALLQLPDSCKQALASYKKNCVDVLTVDQIKKDSDAGLTADEIGDLCRGATDRVVAECPKFALPAAVGIKKSSLEISKPASPSKVDIKQKSTKNKNLRAKKTRVRTGTAGVSSKPGKINLDKFGLGPSFVGQDATLPSGKRASRKTGSSKGTPLSPGVMDTTSGQVPFNQKYQYNPPKTIIEPK